jgi:chromosome segregation ATPase
MVRALGYIDEAESALIDSNWSSAQRGLQYARKYWPGHPKLQTLDRRAKHLEERYASYVENIADCVKHRQYYAALELIQEAQARRIRLPSATTSHVEKVVADIEKRIEKLQKEPKAITFESIYSLVGMVTDSIELDGLL